MALDLGNLQVRISANTGDTVSKIDEVKSSLDGVKSASAEVSTSAQGSFTDISKGMTSLVNGFKSGASGILNSISGLVGGLAGAGIGAAFGLAISGIEEHANDISDRVNDMKDNLYSFAEYADSINTNAIVTGLSTDFVQLYTVMSGITDVDFSTIENAMNTFNKNIDAAINGDKGAIKKFKDLNIAIYGKDGKPKDKETLFQEYIKQVSQLGSEVEKQAALAEMFGPKAGAALMPLVTNSAASYDNIKKIAEEYRLLASDKQLTLGGLVQDWKDIAEASETALNNAKGLRVAEATTTGLQSEADYNAAMIDYLNGGKTTQADIAAKYRKWKEDEVRQEEISRQIAEQDALLDYKMKEEENAAIQDSDLPWYKKVQSAAETAWESFKNGVPIWELNTGLGEDYYQPVTGETAPWVNQLGDVLRFLGYNQMQVATADYNTEAVDYIMRSANSYGVDLNGFSREKTADEHGNLTSELEIWASEIQTAIEDFTSGDYSLTEFKGIIDDMFDAYSTRGDTNETWQATMKEAADKNQKAAELNQQAAKDMQNAANTPVQVNVDFNGSIYSEAIE